jgi:hypothetical protein
LKRLLKAFTAYSDCRNWLTEDQYAFIGKEEQTKEKEARRQSWEITEVPNVNIFFYVYVTLCYSI